MTNCHSIVQNSTWHVLGRPSRFHQVINECMNYWRVFFYHSLIKTGKKALVMSVVRHDPHHIFFLPREKFCVIGLIFKMKNSWAGAMWGGISSTPRPWVAAWVNPQQTWAGIFTKAAYHFQPLRCQRKSLENVWGRAVASFVRRRATIV